MDWLLHSDAQSCYVTHCKLMEELRVMDYSLLLGVHYLSPGYTSSPQVTDKASNLWLICP